LWSLGGSCDTVRPMQNSSIFATLSDPNHVYLDCNATTPVAAFLAPMVSDWLKFGGNPSSIHQAGRKPKALIREARKSLATMIGCDPLEIIFTNGGAEANNLALKGVFENWQKPSPFAKGFRNHYIISAVEHPSIMKTAEFLKTRGARVDVLPVDRDGQIDLDIYKSLLSDQTALVSVMLANNETGHIFPIREMAQMAHEVGALFHTDAVQALGKMPIHLRELGVDLASFSGHKFYSLKGCGILFARKGLQIESLIHGGGQERGRRGGTENVLAIAALGEMSRFSGEVVEQALRLKALRNELEENIKSEIVDVTITGENGLRLSSTSSLVIPGVDGETLLMNLDMRGFAVSTGAACSSGNPEPSPVLLAMGLSREEAQSSLRLSLSWSTTREEILRFIQTLKEVVIHLRSFQNPDTALQKTDRCNS
jgi:cysteine desulfurase